LRTLLQPVAVSCLGLQMKSANMSVLGVGALCALVLFPWNCLTAADDGGFVQYGGSAGSGPVVFSHQSHGLRGAGFPCSRCHTGSDAKTITVTMDGIRQGQACGSCHDGTTRGVRGTATAFSTKDCTQCHMPTSDIVIKLNRMDPVIFSHIRHLGVNAEHKSSRPLGYSCRDCHPTPFERSASSPIGMEVPHETGGCAFCHNGKNRSGAKKPVFAATTRCLTCHKPQS
jgi:c(7)-type cytochrome triheme protein